MGLLGCVDFLVGHEPAWVHPDLGIVATHFFFVGLSSLHVYHLGSPDMQSWILRSTSHVPFFGLQGGWGPRMMNLDY